MPIFSPERLAATTGGHWNRPPSGPLVGFSQDSRRLGPGQVFVALRTPARDGHDFLAAAAVAGASAALVSHLVPGVRLAQLVVADPLAAWHAIARDHRHQFAEPVIGVTGSVGKTSVKNLLALLLGGEAGGVHSTEGNLNNHLGVPLTLAGLEPGRHRFAVIEAGIGTVGEMIPLAAMIEPDLAIVTSIAPAHLAGLGDLAGVAREKIALAAAVRPGGLVILSRACAEFPAFWDLAGRVLLVGPAAEGVWSAPGAGRAIFDASFRAGVTQLALHRVGSPRLDFTLHSTSPGMAQNAALALCAALELGIAPADLRSRLEAWQPAPLRGEIRRAEGRLLYLDCYNASPASMADALIAFDRVAPVGEPRLYVLGGMEELGAQAGLCHRDLGQSLRLGADDFVCLLGPESGAVLAGALAAGASPGQIEVAAGLDAVRDRFVAFRGAVFLKGSRRWRLEDLVTAEPVPAGH